MRRSGHIDRLRNLNLPDPARRRPFSPSTPRILQAVISSNVADAERAVRKHLSGTLNAVEQIKERYPRYF